MLMTSIFSVCMHVSVCVCVALPFFLRACVHVHLQVRLSFKSKKKMGAVITLDTFQTSVNIYNGVRW